MPRIIGVLLGRGATMISICGFSLANCDSECFRNDLSFS